MELKITALAFGGKGLAKLSEDGKTVPVFVRGAVPGDSVEVKIVKIEKKYVEAEIVKIITPSAFRIKPVCEHFGVCGGCQFLNFAYNEQLKHKTQMLKAVLERNVKGLIVNDILPSDKALHYRIRARYTAENGVFGFYKEGSHEIVKINKCYLVDELINEIASKIEILDGEVEIVKNASAEEVYVKGVKIDDKRVVDGVFEIDGLKYSPECFTQVNVGQNRKIVELVVREASGKVLDLYCGIGNYTVPLASKCPSVVGVEGNSKSCEYASLNSKGKKNVKIINTDVEEFLDRKQDEYSAVVLNPSRRSKPIDFSKLKAKKLIYVSCNPEQLSKDLKVLVGDGWKIKFIQPVDMFPQTYHVESVVVMER
jgi:23S rRNA (uracil1939-C5)-methyltransferase